MSKLEELIQGLCPNGVEWKTIGEVCEISKGIQFNKTDMNERGTYPVINGGINPSGYIEKYNQCENTITISQGGASAGYVNWQKVKFWAGAHCYILEATEKIDNRFLFHFVKSQEKKLQECQYGAGIPALAKATITSIQIPVPPIEVQREIVRILDTFTELTTELTTELSARKKQYEYYRDSLLTFSDDVDVKQLYEIADVIDSLHATPKYIKEGYSMIRVADVKGGYVNTINALKVDEETYIKFIERYKPMYNDIIVSRVGSFGNFSLVPDEDICLGQNVALIHPKINNKYLYYYLRSKNAFDYINSNAHGGGYKNIGIKDILAIPIRVPPLAKQQRIVDILDRFDTLCNDISTGLPAEIDARQKQYEFYRDKLLSFKNIAS